MNNIAIITPSLKNGGAERIAGLLSIELSHYYNVFMFVHVSDEMIYDYAGTLIRIDDVQNKYRLSLCEAVRKAKIDNDIDVSISFLTDYNYANIWSRGKDRVIISERNAQSQIRNRMYRMDMITRNYYNYADAIVACSEGVKYDLMTEYGVKEDNIYSIYNYIDQESIRKKSAEPISKELSDWLNGADYFVNVGRLDPQKQQKRLIKQFKHFNQAGNSGMKLVIIGSGILEDELKSIVEEEDLERSVIILPYMSNPFPIIRNSRCVILSSHYEGLPNVILEAMTIGKPIIATDCLAGPRELLNDEKDYSSYIVENKVCKRGLLVPDIDTEDFGESLFLSMAMEWIGNNEMECNSFVSNQRSFMAQYNNGKITEKWISLIERDEKKDIFLPEIEEKILKSAKHLYIYGAGKKGKRIYSVLKDRYSIEAFIVSDGQKKESFEENVPVLYLSDVNLSADGMVVVLGVSSLYADKVVKQLEDLNVRNMVTIGE